MLGAADNGVLWVGGLEFSDTVKKMHFLRNVIRKSTHLYFRLCKIVLMYCTLFNLSES